MLGIQQASNQSIKPYKSSEEYLYAMKEDLAEWLTDLYGVDVHVSNVLEVLETGALLCAHANNVTRVADEFLKHTGQTDLRLPGSGVTFISSAHPTTFLARDNVTNFINWCRKEMGIPDVLMFETDDLVLRKNEKNFVLCLLEVARRASRFGMASPVLIQLEQEIEQEIREEMEDLPAQDTMLPKPQRRLINIQNLDEMVQYLISRCTCPSQFPMVKVSEGKYRVGDSNTLIFVRILRNHVMVRVGGGWDTLEHYLDKHDPCRCSSLVHKLSQRPATPVHEIRERLTTPRPDTPSGSQTTLLLSRSQSPLQPVVWTPSPYRSQRARPSSPRSSCSPDPEPQPTRRRHSLSPNKLRDRVTTPSHMHTCADSKDSSITSSSSRKGRESTRTSPSPRLTNSLPRTPQTPTTPQTEIQQRPQTPLIHQRNQNKIQQGSERNLNQTWTKSHFAFKLRQNATVGVKGRETQDKGHFASDRQDCAGPGRAFQSLTPAQHSSPPSNTQACSNPPNITIHEPEDNEGPKESPNLIRTFSPSKGRMGVISEVHHTRPRTPSKKLHGDGSAEFPVKVRNVLGGSEKSQIEKEGERSVGNKIHHLNLPVQNMTQSPHIGFLNKSSKRVSDSQKSERDSCDLEGGDGGPDHSYLYTPPPLSPAQEAILYKSLEEEILFNLQHLSIDSDTNSSSDEKHNEIPKTSREVSSYNCGISIPSASQDRDQTTRFDSSFTPNSVNGASFDAVIAELSNKQRKTEKMLVEKWVNTLPDGLKGKEEEDHNNSAHLKISKPSLISSCSSMGSSMDSKETVECIKMSDDNHNVETKVSHGKVSSTDTEHTKKQRSSSFKQKRSLKKPERVPSVYKLKLRSCVRPRRDHRSDRRPSKIPTPVFYKRISSKDDNSQNQKGHDGLQHGPCSTEHSRENTWTSPKACVPTPECQRANQETHVDKELESWV